MEGFEPVLPWTTFCLGFAGIAGVAKCTCLWGPVIRAGRPAFFICGEGEELVSGETRDQPDSYLAPPCQYYGNCQPARSRQSVHPAHPSAFMPSSARDPRMLQSAFGRGEGAPRAPPSGVIHGGGRNQAELLASYVATDAGGIYLVQPQFGFVRRNKSRPEEYNDRSPRQHHYRPSAGLWGHILVRQ